MNTSLLLAMKVENGYISLYDRMEFFFDQMALRPTVMMCDKRHYHNAENVNT